MIVLQYLRKKIMKQKIFFRKEKNYKIDNNQNKNVNKNNKYKQYRSKLRIIINFLKKRNLTY